MPSDDWTSVAITNTSNNAITNADGTYSLPALEKISVIERESAFIDRPIHWISPDGSFRVEEDPDSGLPPKKRGDFIRRKYQMVDAHTNAPLWKIDIPLSFDFVGGHIITWSPNSAYVAIVYQPNMDRPPDPAPIFEARTGKKLCEIRLYSPSFSKDGSMIIGQIEERQAAQSASGNNGQAAVYDTRTGQEIIRLPENGIFSPTADQILTRSSLITLRDLSEETDWARDYLGGRELSEEELRQFFLAQ